MFLRLGGGGGGAGGTARGDPAGQTNSDVPDAVFQRGHGVPQGSDLGLPLPERLHQVAVGLLRLFQQLPGC